MPPPVDPAPKTIVSFTDFCVKAGYPAPFPKQIEMKDFGIAVDVPRLLLGSRGYGKTDYITILGTAYEIYLDPTFTVLLITKSKPRNTAMLNEIVKACQANGVNFETDNATCLRVEGLLGQNDSVSAVTVGSSSLRGRHPKLIVMDDPVTPEDISEATRKKLKRVYNEAFKLTENILIVGQPVHKFDLYADLRPILKKMEVPYGSIPELDCDLEAQRLAGIDEASIQASYFLTIVNEGGSPFDKIQYLDHFPTGGTSVAFMDPSDGGDNSAVSIFRQHMQGVAVVGFTWKKRWDHCLDDLVPIFKKFGVQKLCFETNKHGLQPLDVLREVFPAIGVVGRSSNNNKHSRIVTAGTYSHMIFLSKESTRAFIDQVVQYEYGSKVDDAPDSLATGLEWIGYIKGKR